MFVCFARSRPSDRSLGTFDLRSEFVFTECIDLVYPVCLAIENRPLIKTYLLYSVSKHNIQSNLLDSKIKLSIFR